MLAAVGAAGCVDLSSHQSSVTLWDTQLTPAVGYPGLSGQAAAVSDASGTSVGIAIHGAASGAQHAWGLRFGNCAAPAQQIGSNADYPLLVVGTTGSDSVETHLGFNLTPGGLYHVAVRVSASDTSRIACGDLVAR